MKLNLEIENCYGITQLRQDLDFKKNRSLAIYAPNGTMKTSFAKIFLDISRSEKSKDLFFENKTPIRIIKKDGVDIDKDYVFVIQSYVAEYESTLASTLMVNDTLRKEYNDIYNEIKKAEKNVLNVFKSSSGCATKTEKQILADITPGRDDFYQAIKNLKDTPVLNEYGLLKEIKYNDLLNEKTIKLLNEPGFINKLKIYIEQYDNIISQSTLLRKDFNHNNVEAISSELGKNNFFSNSNYLTIIEKSNNPIEYKSKEDLDLLIENEKQRILNNDSLLSAFHDIEKSLNGNEQTRKLKEIISQNRDIIPLLLDLNKLKYNFWKEYQNKNPILIEEYLKKYEEYRERILYIFSSAKKEKTRWENVLNIFKTRFSVPFEVSIKNQAEVILKADVPALTFSFKGKNGQCIETKKENLMQNLSNGERRAFYILNILFDIESLKESGKEKLIIIDDIADSFDYKNKYAIMEYIKEISEFENFYLIVLTHNFDFFRSIIMRCKIDQAQSYIANIKNTTIQLFPADYVRNPFLNWIKNYKKISLNTIISLIPFVRNIIEYTEGENNLDYLKLTSILHFKEETPSISFNDVDSIFKKYIKRIIDMNNNISNVSVVEKIFEIAETYERNSSTLELESKVLLAITIRLLAERYIISKIDDHTPISKNQFNELFERFTKQYKSDPTMTDKLSLLTEINIMTPENIHLNSFMYEPILDMSSDNLVDLYKRVKSKLSIQENIKSPF